MKRRDFLRRLPLIGAGAVVAPAVVAKALEPAPSMVRIDPSYFMIDPRTSDGIAVTSSASDIEIMNATGRSWPSTHYHPDKETCVKQFTENMRKAEQKMFWPKETV